VTPAQLLGSKVSLLDTGVWCYLDPSMPLRTAQRVGPSNASLPESQHVDMQTC